MPLHDPGELLRTEVNSSFPDAVLPQLSQAAKTGATLRSCLCEKRQSRMREPVRLFSFTVCTNKE